MPAKKRKSAKKRRKRQPTSILQTSLKSVVMKTTMLGNNDLKSHYEKESDGGEASSSANGEGEGTQKVELQKEVDWVVRELEPDENSKSKRVSIEYLKESPNGGSSGEFGSSDSNSFDEESGFVEKSLPMMEQGKLEEKVQNSVMETVLPTPLVDSVVWLSEEVTQVVEATPVENTRASDVIEFASKGKEVKLSPPSDENTGVLGDLIDLDLKENVDKMLRLSAENNGLSSGVMDLASNENDDKLLQSSDAEGLSVEASNGSEHCKKWEIPESSENQPLIASAPRTVQPSSWKSCCGLFDVLMGSNR